MIVEVTKCRTGNITWSLNTGWAQGPDRMWVVAGRVEEVVAE